jgi:hypothetical protein
MKAALALSIKHPTHCHLSVYSSQGLRTLAFASSVLSDAELQWQSMYEEVSTSLIDQAAKLRVRFFKLYKKNDFICDPNRNI